MSLKAREYYDIHDMLRHARSLESILDSDVEEFKKMLFKGVGCNGDLGFLDFSTTDDKEYSYTEGTRRVMRALQESQPQLKDAEIRVHLWW
jgi:hypothetical protein